MASAARGLAGLRVRASVVVSASSNTVLAPCRRAVCTRSGAVLPKPKKTSFGLVRIAMVVVPFLYVGTLISKNFAALLEEHDIFVPEDDDDDD
ncbi:essential MCU regulator, mitochondrial [Electrophorus electricus]|uniref:Essential MCU regulator, mitochondrial n=1 Tax=Electrophorus electricus TaxID=8005 RepID=A0A4W4F9T1_ELEEL|nr:essential MCU regulator, mitochondrial [Electrophorus electricus]